VGAFFLLDIKKRRFVAGVTLFIELFVDFEQILLSLVSYIKIPSNE